MPWFRDLALASALLTGGCASFDGMPKPIITVDAAAAHVANHYSFDAVVSSMAGQDGGSRTIYRNRVAAAYLTAIDARYFEFRRGLSRGMKGGNLGFDIALLSLTGAAAVWNKAADELAAAATGVAAARGSFNR